MQRKWLTGTDFVQTGYGNYDEYGNAQLMTTYPDYNGGGTPRQTTTVYDEHGLLPTQVTNPAGQDQASF